MSDPTSRPTPADIKARALAIVEETMAYPADAQARLMEIKRGAIQRLVDDFEAEREMIAKHYPGWTIEDLKSLIALLPRSKSGDQWHL